MFQLGERCKTVNLPPSAACKAYQQWGPQGNACNQDNIQGLDPGIGARVLQAVFFKGGMPALMPQK